MATTAVSPDTYQSVKECARKVIIDMGTRKVMLTPENYHLWFVHISGGNAALSKDIEALKAANHPFTDEILAELYKRHIASGARSVPGSGPEEVDAEAVLDAQERTETLLKTLLSEVLSTSSSAAAYNNSLKDYSKRIATAKGVTELQALVRDLLTDTAGMAKSSENLQGKLEQATHEAEQLRQKLTEARRDALVDGLTGVHNRRALDAKLAALIDEFTTRGTRFSVIMIDIDHFKPFNDNHGHQAGDEVLRQVGAMLIDTVDDDGFPARYGGEEFSVVVPSTGLEGARYMAERIRMCVSKLQAVSPTTGETLRNITASLGVAEIWRGDSVESVVARADQALYAAKQSGRNRVKTEADLEG